MKLVTHSGIHLVAVPGARPGGRRARPVWLRWRGAARARGRAAERGMATAEYAVATLAAAGFAGLLLALLRSAEVRALLAGIIRRALAAG